MALSLAEERDRLLSRSDLVGRQWTRAFSDVADTWLRGIFPKRSRIALVALGSHGRRELCPYSDLDLMFVHRGLRSVDEVSSELWYPIWDSGFGLDHSVKSIKDALEVAKGDIRAMLGLVDLRFICGDQELANELASRTMGLWQRDHVKFLMEIANSMRSRYDSSGDLAFLLEPDLKEARGGLRDFAIYSALMKAKRPFSSEVDMHLLEGHDLLLAARVELHRRSRKGEDRLLLQEQDQVASLVGMADADELMGKISEAARAISYAVNRLARFDSTSNSKTISGSLKTNPLVKFRSVQGELEIELPEDVGLGVVQVLEIASVSAHGQLPIQIPSLIGIRASLDYDGGRWPAGALSQLVSLLGTARSAIFAIESLEFVRLFTALLPEWDLVRSKPQRNAYHRFTVDRHLLEAAANAALYRREVHRPDLLLLGALFHDIGKGVANRDHTEAGVELMDSIAVRIGLNSQDTAIIKKLIEHHLLLADMAMKRDVSDPMTVEKVADALGDLETLELLEKLTEADSLATGSAAWSHWKKLLISDLVSGVKSKILGAEPKLSNGKYNVDLLDELAESCGSDCAVSVHPDGLFVAAPDRPGLFSAVTGALALVGFSVVGAEVFTHRDVAIEVFQTMSEWESEFNWEKFKKELPKALAKPEDVEKKLLEKRKHYRKRQLTAEGLQLDPKVLIDQGASATATVVEVWGPDRIGLLHELTRVIAVSGLSITKAKVLTLGDDVIDTFYLVDGQGNPIADDEAISSLRTSLMEVVSNTAG